MKSAFSDESIGAVRKVVDAMRRGDDLTWDSLANHLGLSRTRLQDFLDDSANYVPKVSALRKLLDGIETYLADTPNSAALRLCPDEISVVLGRSPSSLGIVKSELRLEDSDQMRLADEMSGTYLVARPWADRGIFVGHLRVLDTYSRQGMPICHFRRKLKQGGDLKVTAAVFRRSPKLYILGHETTNHCLLTMSLHQRTGRFDILTGIMSGFETNGDSFACKVLIARINEDVSYRSFRHNTGLFECTDDLSQLVNNMCKKPNEALTEMIFGPSAYLSHGVGD